MLRDHGPENLRYHLLLDLGHSCAGIELLFEAGDWPAPGALGFTYNPAGQIKTTTRSNDAYAWGGHYNINRSYAVDGLNRITQIASPAVLTPSYDGRGNLIADGTGASYGYTSENALVTAPAGATLAYDPFGRLRQIAKAGVTTRMLYDGPDLLTELDGTNSVMRRYVHGPGVDDPIAWYEGSGITDRRFLHKDERGSVVAVTDASGAAMAVNSYDEQGMQGVGNLGYLQRQHYLAGNSFHRTNARATP